MQTGSLINHLMDTSGPLAPEVGMGATLVYWTDRHPATVIEVSRTGHRIVVQEDTSTRTDSYGMSDAQSYEFTPNPHGTKHVATRRKDGSYRISGDGTRVLLGSRSRYHDYSF